MSNHYLIGQLVAYQVAFSFDFDAYGEPYVYKAPKKIVRVLAFSPAYPTTLICEGNDTQEAMGQWVQEACNEAGVPPDQKVRLVFTGELL